MFRSEDLIDLRGDHFEVLNTTDQGQLQQSIIVKAAGSFQSGHQTRLHFVLVKVTASIIAVT